MGKMHHRISSRRGRRVSPDEVMHGLDPVGQNIDMSGFEERFRSALRAQVDRLGSDPDGVTLALSAATVETSLRSYDAPALAAVRARVLDEETSGALRMGLEPGDAPVGAPIGMNVRIPRIPRARAVPDEHPRRSGKR